MKTKAIHIVSFDVPYPSDYGGVIDVFHRCKNLKKIGVKVMLHCFEYGRGQPKELEEIADEVYYYPRKKSVFSFFSFLPFIVKTRNHRDLLKNLSKDDAPILFEGIHTCFLLAHKQLEKRWKGVRAHNVEHDYYRELAKVEKNIFKKCFFKSEAWKLIKFESVFHQADEILSVTPKDNDYFQKKYRKGVYVPVFNPLNRGNETRKVEQYALFHGNLSVMENEFAVRYLVDKVWKKDIALQLIIAGKNPSDSFVEYLKKQPFELKCVPNPSDEQLNKLIRNAKINLLPTFQNTGIKHKLLNCLSNGGFCLVNPPMVEGTGLEKFCFIAHSVEEWRSQIHFLTEKEENPQLFIERQQVLQRLFDVETNAHKIVEIIEKCHLKTP